MIRLAAGAALMAASAYIGVGIDKFYKMRVEFLKSLLDFLDYAAREAGFLKTGILNIISLYCEAESSALTHYLKQTAEQLQSGQKAVISCAYLTNRDKRLYESFFAGLAGADYKSQQAHFARCRAETETLIKDAEKNKKNKGELIRKLMALGGVALMVIVI